MSEAETALMFEILKDVQARMSNVEKGIVRTHVEIAALGQLVAGLTTAVYSGHDRFMEIEQRIERIEARLELTSDRRE